LRGGAAEEWFYFKEVCQRRQGKYEIARIEIRNLSADRQANSK